MITGFHVPQDIIGLLIFNKDISELNPNEAATFEKILTEKETEKVNFQNIEKVDERYDY